MLRRGRAIVAGLLVNLLVISSFILSNPTSAAACPEERPKTLLQLYRSSDAIYIARFARLEKGKLLRREENFEIFGRKRHFDIESELKGGSREHFALEEEDWVYSGAPAEGWSPEPSDEDADMDDYEISLGDRILLFLKRDEADAQKLVLADYRDGVRKLSDEALPVYQKRIKELNSIFIAGDPSDDRIVDWLVEVAEDPITRWEGTFELLQAFETLEWREQEEKAETGNTEDIVDGVEKEVTVELLEEGPGSGSEEDGKDEDHSLRRFDNSSYAKALSDVHKQRLSNILLNSQHREEGIQTEKVKGDMELVNLVHRWGDSRVAEALLFKLDAGYGTTWDNSSIMSAIAKLIADAKLTKLADEYGDIAWGEDDAELETDEPEKPESVVETKTSDAPLKTLADVHGEPEIYTNGNDVKTEPAATEASTMVEVRGYYETKASPYSEKSKKPDSKRITFGQKRSELMSEFLSKASDLLEQKRAIAGNGQK